MNEQINELQSSQLHVFNYLGLEEKERLIESHSFTKNKQSEKMFKLENDLHISETRNKQVLIVLIMYIELGKDRTNEKRF